MLQKEKKHNLFFEKPMQAKTVWLWVKIVVEYLAVSLFRRETCRKARVN